MSAEPRFDLAARCLHWITAAVLIAVVIPAGIWIHYFEPADQAFKMRLYNLHESFGVCMFVLALLRMWNRSRSPAPPLPGDLPGTIRLAAHTTQICLYALLVLMPITGFLATNAWGFTLKMFDVLPLPSPIGKDEALAKTLSLLHWIGAVAIVLFIAAHVGGALYHQFIRRDGILRRML